MSDVIYLQQGDGQLIEMTEASRVGEGRLQSLLEEHPNLLAGSQINQESPRRWLLIDRELLIPDREEGSGRWILDHLFLDQDGVPTIVEVKMSSDARIRREVIGQMLDYGANAVVYYPVERMQAHFEAKCDQDGGEPEEVVSQALGREDYERFWQAVGDNLKAGRIRMLFLADAIPSELRTIIEFLNEQMSPAEVLGIELKQYAADSHRALVPKVLGQTQQALAKKTTRQQQKISWTDITFDDAMTRVPMEWLPEDVQVWQRLSEWARDHDLTFRWIDGRYEGLYFGLSSPGILQNLFGIQLKQPRRRMVKLIDNHVLGWRECRQPFDENHMKIRLAEKLNTIEGISIATSQIRKNPKFEISVLRDNTKLDAFLHTFEWVNREFENVE